LEVELVKLKLNFFFKLTESNIAIPFEQAIFEGTVITLISTEVSTND
jgi:hypothetical protein